MDNNFNNDYNNNGYNNGNYNNGNYNNGNYNNGNYNWNNQQYVNNTAYNGYYAASKAEMEQKVVVRGFLVMFFALMVAAASAIFVASDTSRFLGMYENLTVLLILELVVFFVADFAVRKKNVVLAAAFFTIYCVCTGATLSVIFMVYDLSSIKSIFLVTAAVFGIMAVVGSVTKIDLTKAGSLLGMFLLGAFIVSIVNIFVGNSALDLILDYIFVAIFVGYTAYDTQKLKNSANYISDSEVNATALYFGMQLFLDFLNLFLRLLSLFGKRK